MKSSTRFRVDGLYAAGFVSYEAAPAFDPALAVHSAGDFPLLWFGVYREPEQVSFPSSQQDLPGIPWEPSVTEDEYQQSIGRIKDYIGAGDTYQVNYTFHLRAPFPDDPWKLFVRMIHAQGYGYGAFVNTGTVGFLTPGHKAQFNVAIRTVLVDRVNNTAEYGTGGGIVWDSEKGDELQECYTKAMVLTRTTPDFSLLETILWTPQGGYFLLDAHLKRLADSADYFSRSIDIESIREKLNALSHELPPHPHRIRLVVPENGEPVVERQILSSLPQPYRIKLAGSPVDPGNHFLYHKTTYRHIYEQALAEAPGYDDVLLWNEKGEVTESCIANVVVEMDGELLTPPVQSGLLPGIYRSFLLEQGKVREESIKVEDLWQCTRIYLVNSVRGMWEVSFRPKGEPLSPGGIQVLPYFHMYDMINHMKTTLNISDVVMNELKAEAARQGRTMSELVEAALRSFLEESQVPENLPPLPDFNSGGARVDVANRDALYEVLER